MDLIIGGEGWFWGKERNYFWRNVPGEKNTWHHRKDKSMNRIPSHNFFTAQQRSAETELRQRSTELCAGSTDIFERSPEFRERSEEFCAGSTEFRERIPSQRGAETQQHGAETRNFS